MKLDYKAMFLKKSWFKSFTLIELSVVLFVIAILSTTGIGIYKKMNPQHASDVKKMKEIQLALDRYFAVHKRLPRPANITVLPTLVDFGKEVNLGVNPGFRKQSFGGTSGRETGFIVGGGLPVVELGLDNSYAFDSYGVKYNELGNYDPDVMPQEDIRAFRELQEKAIEYYNGFTVLSSHVKGKLTCYSICTRIHMIREEQKKFFESYAEYWKKLSLDTYAKGSLSTDVHAPSPVRVNAVVACFDEYYDIYDVTEGDPMYVAPEDRVRRW